MPRDLDIAADQIRRHFIPFVKDHRTDVGQRQLRKDG